MSMRSPPDVDSFPELAPAFVAAAIGTFSMCLATFALRHQRTAASLRAIPPAVKCFVSGLLSGLGLIVMLPSALEKTPPGIQVNYVLVTFCAAPVTMYFIHHVILDHKHVDQACAPHIITVDRKRGVQITTGPLQFNKMPMQCVKSGVPRSTPDESEDGISGTPPRVRYFFIF